MEEENDHHEHQVEEHSEYITENGDQANYADSIIQIEEEVCNSLFVIYTW